MIPLVLASSSLYRQRLLRKLQVPFVIAKPSVDERVLTAEKPQRLVQRLAVDKVQSVAADFPRHLIIGGDTVGYIDQEVLGKPHNRAEAFRQLRQQSGKKVSFYSGLCVYSTIKKKKQVKCVETRVQFRVLSDTEIDRYLTLDRPYNSSGAIRSEESGIMLFEKITSPDPYALIGLPLIALDTMLRKEGVSALSCADT